jgi:hypothetical protein
MGMLATGMLIQYGDITVAVSFASEHTLALPAIWTFVAVSLFCGLLHRLTRLRLLTRAELLCVMFCMLISAPLMTQGFWHRVVAILATNPRMADFEKLDAMSDRLWPHGPNLIRDVLRPDNPYLVAAGNCTWKDVAVEEGRTARVPVLENRDKDGASALRIRLPADRGGAPFVMPGEPYMISVLARPADLGPTAKYHCRIRAEGVSAFTEFFSSSLPSKVNFLHPGGFRRVGAYGVKFPPEAARGCVLEFGLSGNGRVELWDAKLFNVAVLEGLYRGKQEVTASQYAALPVEQRANLIVKPDHMWSVAGVRFLLAGYIPVADWAMPVLVWTLFVLVVLTAILALNILMRRQWLDSERFQLPAARVPAALLDDEGAETGSFPAIWSNRLMYVGFAVALAWVMLKAWHFYNPKVPDVAVKVFLQEYFTDPSWGQMWSRWRFEIEGIFLAMCVFMELNVLLSLVLGYVAFRGLYWVGEVSGLTIDPNYPYAGEQTIGAYLGYAAILLVFARKHVWRAVKAAARGDRAESAGEALSYRGALALLILSVAGGVAWARWMGIAPWSMLVFVVFLVTIGLVASRIRAECGTPWGYFAPPNLALFMGLLGGVWRFGAEAMIFCYIASFMLGPTVFYLIPGAQMELLGLGRRWNVRPRDLVVCATLGVLGGMAIGGWVFLSNAYAMGGDTSRYQWAFDTKWWYFFSYNQDVAVANNNFLVQGASAAAPGQAAAHSGLNPAWLATGLAAAVAMGLAALRQFFSGFWFHPVGFVLSSTNFMDYIWGSALTAWVVRSVVLRLGGAATVRNKLQPFFVGVFLGTCSAYLLILIHSAYLRAIGLETIYPILTP